MKLNFYGIKNTYITESFDSDISLNLPFYYPTSGCFYSKISSVNCVNNNSNYNINNNLISNNNKTDFNLFNNNIK